MFLGYRHSVLATLLVTTLHGGALANEPLPSSMSGRWTARLPSGQEVGNIWSITIEKQDGKGALEGKLTYYGVFCGARNEPMTGVFDGSVLRINSHLRPNTNTERAGGQCGSGKTVWTLRKQTGRNSFDGEVELEGVSVKVRAYLNP